MNDDLAQGDRYVIETRVGMPPASWWADLGQLLSTMTVDMPSGERVVRQEHWTPERIEKRFRVPIDMGDGQVISVARDKATGRLVGYTEMTYAPGSTIVHQGDTLVASAHRGHQLGLALKAAALTHAAHEFPAATSSETSNAIENAPMIRTNALLGYEPVAILPMWIGDLV